MTIITAVEALNRVQDAAKTHTNNDRFIRTMSPGQYARQGDVYLVRLKDAPMSKGPLQELQLAPGETKGSRHVAVGVRELVKPSDWQQDSGLAGPAIESGKRFTVTHPEHGHISLPSGRYGVRYQQDLESEEIARVQD